MGFREQEKQLIKKGTNQNIKGRMSTKSCWTNPDWST